MTRSTTALALAGAIALGATAPAAADSILFRCGANICRAAPDGSLRRQLTTDGNPAGPAYSWLSASRTGERMAVAKAGFAYVLDGSGRQLGEALPRGGTALVAEIAPDASLVATLELLGESTPPPFTSPPGTPPTLNFVPYMFTTAPDGSGRNAVARSIVDTAWLGARLVRSDTSDNEPFSRGFCLLVSNDDFQCERDVARDLANDLSAPALSPDGRLLAVARSPADQNAGVGPIVIYDVASAGVVRTLTAGAGDAQPSFSPDGRQIAFSRGNDIYVTPADGGPGRERRAIAGGQQPEWVSGGDACRLRGSVRPSARGRSITVRACAPSAGRLTVTLTRQGRRLARRTVTTRIGGSVSVRFPRPSGRGAVRATVRFREA